MTVNSSTKDVKHIKVQEFNHVIVSPNNNKAVVTNIFKKFRYDLAGYSVDPYCLTNEPRAHDPKQENRKETGLEPWEGKCLVTREIASR